MAGLVVGCLGPLQLSSDGHQVLLSSHRARIVLVVLALAAQQPVSVERLVAAAWEDASLPRDPRSSLQTMLSRLRTAVGPDSIETESAGYRLTTDPDDVDVLRFLRLLRGLPEADAQVIDEALGLWRGEPFADLRSPWLDRFERPNLIDQYLAGVERRADLAFESGDAASQLPRLNQLATRYPLREPLLARLLLALDQLGRSAEALQRYDVVRTELADALGVDPGPELQGVHAQLLQRTAAGSGGDSASPARVGPLARQLPAAVTDFVGRSEALNRLDALLTADSAAPAPVAVLSAIAGAAGAGKTTLALHWAHRVSERFPDGQLYVNLRGFDPAGRVMDPADAVRGFLDALGVTPERIPTDPDARSGLYRSVLAGKRILVILDNARDADQVRPLLPGSAGCLTLVTSRNQLAGLVAAQAAALITVDLLSHAEARQLLAVRIGAERVAAEPDATDQIIDSCAGLPLALAVVAARAAMRRALPLAALAAELRESHHRLDALSGDDPATDVRTVFSWSYRALTQSGAQLFRLLSLHPGPDIDLAAAASLAGVGRTQTRSTLAELSAAHLVTEHRPGRYQVHDLLRAYADELSVSEDSDAERANAVRRMVEHYLHTAQASARVGNGFSTINVPPPSEGVTTDRYDDRAAAMAWFTAEREVLVGVIQAAFDAGLDLQLCALAQELTAALWVEARWSLRLTTGTLALQGAIRLGEPSILSRVHRWLLDTNLDLGCFDQAHEHARWATELADTTGDANEQGHAARLAAFVHQRQGNFDLAGQGFHRALDCYRTAGNERRVATSLDDIGRTELLAGNAQDAIEFCRTALDLQQRLDDPLGTASTWRNLGEAHRMLDEPDRAIACFQQAVQLLHDAGYFYFEAVVLDPLGDTYEQQGDTLQARAAWTRAAEILDELNHPDADAVHAKLQAR